MKRLPQVKWSLAGRMPSGSRYWLSLDGMFRIVSSDRIDDIALPRVWVLWQWRAGTWRRVLESRSRLRVDRRARQLAAAYDDAEE